MAKLREHLQGISRASFSKPEYVDHKKQLWWGSSERRSYLRTYIGYAAEKAAYNLVYALTASVLVMYAQPRPAPIEIRLLTPGTATHQTDTRAEPSTIYNPGAQHITIWTNGRK